MTITMVASATRQPNRTITDAAGLCYATVSQSGHLRVHTTRPLSVDELLEFELPARPRINGRARVLREQGYRVYALRFEKLGDEARAEIASLASAATPPAPAR